MSDFLPKEPTSFVAGDTVKWERTNLYSDYPPASWALKYSLVGLNDGIGEQTAAEDGNNYQVTIAASVTATLDGGDYTLTGYVDDGTQRFTVYRGTVTVEADIAGVDGGRDTRSYWKRVYDNVSAVIEGKASSDQQSYSIAGRSLSRYSFEELLALQGRARAEVLREERAASGAGGKKILTRFVKP